MRALLRVRLRTRAVAALVALLVTAAAAATAGVILSRGGSAAHCSSFGTSWARTYNSTAVKRQNPLRILAACCAPTATVGVNACLLTIGQVGVSEHGCEQVDLDSAGAVVSEGKHATCP